MRSGVGLCVLGLLCLHSSVFSQPGVLIFCDDPLVEMAANSALIKFNEGLTSGHKLALYQTLSASKSENGSDSVYSLQFTSRKSDCEAGNSKPWTECNYLPSGPKEPISCNATVLITDTEPEATHVHCQLDEHIVPVKAQCLGCPVKIDASDDLITPLSHSIIKYNSDISDSTHLFSLNTISHATRQVVAGLRYKLRFDMRKTKCTKSENQDPNELCVPDEENEEFANCNSTVDVAPWRHELPQAQLKCEPGALAITLFTRRRPPGWSPLRNFLYNVPSVASTPSSSPPTSPPPPPPPSSPSSTAVAQEESSEEDTTAAKPTASVLVIAEEVNDSPFHCPSKPWKVFNPAPDAAPTKASVDSSPQPSADGAFSDTDLLG